MTVIKFDNKRKQPSKAAKQAVRDAFDANKLIDVCERDDFSVFAKRHNLVPYRGRERFFYFEDNGADILAVAHLDTVQDDRSCKIIETAAGPLVCSGGLDDRLGAYVILDMLPKLGVKCDILLTTDEEMGQSTASDFVPEKSYNWIIQFDRAGTDVVMYQYETPELVDLVENSGAQVGIGSYSDISDLDHLGCAGFNWGVGYQEYHSERSHAWLEDTFRMVARFVKFYRANVDEFLAYDYNDWGDDLIKADCGHEIDVDDPNTYVELDRYDVICIACAESYGLTWEVGAS
jgi:hypothetical protein